MMQTVRKAERRLHETQATKSYLGLAGDAVFNELMIGLVMGEADRSRLRAAQTPAARVRLERCRLLRLSRPDATVRVPSPTWPNHVPIVTAAGLKTGTYPYFNTTTNRVDFDAMMAALENLPAGRGTARLLPQSDRCRPSPEHWKPLAELLVRKGLIPFVDIAYQGFGEGLEQDAAGLRILADTVPELLVAASCSKNFSVYRDRAGAAIIMARNSTEADTAYSQLQGVGRCIWSMPPDHAAACVRIVLHDDDLRTNWKDELEAVRLRMLTLRTGFAEALRRQSDSERFDFIAAQRRVLTSRRLRNKSCSCAKNTASTSSATAAALPACREIDWTTSPQVISVL